ncbi:TPA: PfkB family carbohydrate kinase, partial [Enterococcus faecium]
IKLISKNNYLSVITINGSVNNPDPFLYAKLLQYIKEQIDPSTYILMDISGQHLREVLASKYKPMFIKPNIHEFSDIIHQKITQKSDIKHHLKTNPLFKDIDVIMISCGSYGAVVKVKEEFWNVEIPKIPIINTTGSGDATVGGFAHSLEQNYPLKECVRYAMACGMSNAQQSEVGKVIPADVKNLAKSIKITEMK